MILVWLLVNSCAWQIFYWYWNKHVSKKNFFWSFLGFDLFNVSQFLPIDKTDATLVDVFLFDKMSYLLKLPPPPFLTPLQILVFIWIASGPPSSPECKTYFPNNPSSKPLLLQFLNSMMLLTPPNNWYQWLELMCIIVEWFSRTSYWTNFIRMLESFF